MVAAGLRAGRTDGPAADREAGRYGQPLTQAWVTSCSQLPWSILIVPLSPMSMQISTGSSVA
jgi:hypothetical protein